MGNSATLADQARVSEDATIVEKPGRVSGVATGWSVPAPAQATGGYAASLAVLHPGTLLGNRYEIIRQLGQGGMGAVYQAKDREVDRMVAVKVIRPELAGHPEILQRFKQELILARQVTHRNVIRIFDLGEADGIKFITMEYIEGRDLKSLLVERGKFPPAEAVGIVQQVCLALEAAHTEGVVHRDLKPQNIMVDQQGKVAVMDFGIARSMELGGMTQTGALVGTPEYMSPEQVQGLKVDARSDLFTLGIIFYELLTGKMPYQADTALGTMFKRTKERAVPLAQIDPAVPQFLSDVAAKCLETEAQQRYQSAREILQDLEAWQAGAVRRAMNPLQRWLRYAPRYQKWLAAGAMVVVLALAGFVFRQKLPFHLTLEPGAAVQPVSLAILPFRNASGDAAMDWLGPSLAEMLRTDVGQSASLRTVPADRLHQILKDLRIPANADFDPATLKRLAEFSSAETLVWGSYAKIGEQIRIDATLEDLKRQRTVPLKVEAPNEKELLRAIEQMAQSIQQNLAISPDMLKELRAKALQPSSKSLQALRDYNEGLQLGRQGNHLEAVKRFEAATQQDPEFALAYSKLGQTYFHLGYDDKAEQFSRKAVELSEKLPLQERYLIEANHARILNDSAKAIASYENLAKVSPEDPEVQFNLGGLYEATGAFDQARDRYSKVLARDPKHVDALLATGRVEIKRKNPQGSLDYLNRALSLAVELDNAEEKAAILQAIGVAYKRLNKPGEALRYYQESLDIKRRLGQKGGMAATLNEMAQVQGLLGKPAEAFKSYQEALQFRREIGDKKGIGATLIDLGALYSDRGQYDEALKADKEALQIQREVGNQNYEALCLNNIGNIYLLKGQYDDALTYFERALQLGEKFKIPGDTALTLHNLADTSSRLGQFDQAVTYYLRALELWRDAGDKRGAAMESYYMAAVFEYQGRYGAALKSTEEAVRALRELQDHGLLAESLSGYGNALSLVGRFDEAQKNLGEALNLARELQNKALIAQTLNFQGDRFFYRGDFKSARTAFEQALQVAQQTKDRPLTLLAQINLAKVSIKEGRPQAVLGNLSALAKEANGLGLKYLATESALDLAEGLLNTKQVAAARKELEAPLRASEKLNLRALRARNHYLLARALQLTGNGTEAARHSAEARRILEEIRREAGNDAILTREDLKPIAAAPGRHP
ncbi:MAG: tetratricopeptide repeat protein [Acidobacteria bacterium]|nr:tetratricopeptide repeat protein [Acidobacteriota bacterium]